MTPKSGSVHGLTRKRFRDYSGALNPWLINPPWQHFSSLVRESISTKDESNEFVRYHHQTSALYFGIAFIEALLNRKYREVLERGGTPEDEIYKTLRDGQGGFKKKFTSWPSLICGKEIYVSNDLIELLASINSVRSDLTHPKTTGGDVYEKLESVDVDAFTGAVAEYAVTLFSGLGDRYPYWLFGWNYVSNAKNSFTPMLINDQQFVHSLAILGLKLNAFDACLSTGWRDANMRDIAGFLRVKAFLDRAPECEPGEVQFPFKPRLCKRWWDSSVLAKHPAVAQPFFPEPAPGLIRSALKIVTPIYVERKGQPS